MQKINEFGVLMKGQYRVSVLNSFLFGTLLLLGAIPGSRDLPQRELADHLWTVQPFLIVSVLANRMCR
jgi:hypothetical protein